MSHIVNSKNGCGFFQVMITLCLFGFAFDLRSETLANTFFDMSLEELADIEITSVAKKPQKKSFAASSVFVVSQQDIKRSGVTTIPDALRMVPGVQVAKLDSNKWAISIRGFNDIFTNKLLILVDGRTVYSPFFGGARWDTIDTILQDIERIEVVRGPGGTLWGANAVNGVINIITKKAKDSAGLLLSALAGNKEKGQLSIRYGGDINKNTQYRIYAKGFEKDRAENGADDWRMGRAGFRVDSEPSQQDKVTIQTGIYAGEEGERAISNVTTPPFGTFASKAEVFGSHVLLRWDRNLEDGANLTLQAYYDRAERKHFYVSDKRDTVDIDFQHRLYRFWKQEFVWGAGFRYIGDKALAGTLMSLSSEKRSDQIYSGFIQDEISLIDEQLILTLGSKVEHNSYTGFEYQPSARLLWKPYDKHSLWGAVSRAVRVPSRVEQDAFLQRRQIVPGVVLAIQGNRKMKAEKLIAYELGYRFLEKQFSFDLSVFYNKYDNLRSVEKSSTTLPGFFPLILGNKLYGETYGIELSTSWAVNKNWRLQGGYSFIQMQLHKEVLSTDTTEEADEGDTPHHQFNLRSLWQMTEQWKLDTAVRYVGRVKEASLSRKGAVVPYVTIDLRLAWQARKELELSVVGQNLLGKHREFRGSTVDTQATDVEPSVYVKVDWHI